MVQNGLAKFISRFMQIERVSGAAKFSANWTIVACCANMGHLYVVHNRGAMLGCKTAGRALVGAIVASLHKLLYFLLIHKHR